MKILWHESENSIDGFRMIIDFMILQPDASLGILQQTRHEVHQCRFTGAIGTEQSEPFTGCYFEMKIFKTNSLLPGILKCEVLNLYGRGTHAGHFIFESA
jgi:hypothetical protein